MPDVIGASSVLVVPRNEAENPVSNCRITQDSAAGRIVGSNGDIASRDHHPCEDADFCERLVGIPSGSLRGVSSAGVSDVAASSHDSSGSGCVTVFSLGLL